eukprot:CAMPEP_0172520702 /NCGR_PEP_ID=MMETSP1066-20121228/292157_1 /TAXON_ID=671091 /ORGANISM="Coscinodiscus wailesii, Strain CCMP2513" /LENGTH=804 /DNA_ID=CAMNT_0013303507 /DNA_START=812 /DNA_END=3226 /DNA_ORIENTATION=-
MNHPALQQAAACLYGAIASTVANNHVVQQGAAPQTGIVIGAPTPHPPVRQAAFYSNNNSETVSTVGVAAPQVPIAAPLSSQSVVAPPKTISQDAASALATVHPAPNSASMLTIPPERRPPPLPPQESTVPPRITPSPSLPTLSAAPPSPSLSQMQEMRQWPLNRLESHIQHLRRTHGSVPSPLVTLLADARRKEAKKTAKRVANRKSACTSRARKKALMEEMAKTNQRLKRQALILSLLPDLVVAMSVDGVITFVSAQVERILQLKVEDVIGVNLLDLVEPSSRDALKRLIGSLLKNDDKSKKQEGREVGAGDGTVVSGSSNSQGVASDGSSSSRCNPVVVSEESFPTSVVVKNSQKASSSFTNPLSYNSTSSVSFYDENGKEATVPNGGGNTNAASPANDSNNKPSQKNGSLSDDSSSEAAKMGEALNRNVQLHNEKLQSANQKNLLELRHQHTDDVTGAPVNANNADARLSSLQHRPMQQHSPTLRNYVERVRGVEDEHESTSSDSLLAGVEEGNRSRRRRRRRKMGEARARNDDNGSEDLEYREGSDGFSSREDSSSSADENSSNSRTRRSSLIPPTYNIRLIRGDLTTIWCEVTSSIRSFPIETLAESNSDPKNNGMTTTTPSESNKSESKTGSSKNAKSSSQSNGNTTDAAAANTTETAPSQDDVQEVLLCLRPMGEGEKVSEELRFRPSNGTTTIKEQPMQHQVTETTERTLKNGTVSTVSRSCKPMKKRFVEIASASQQQHEQQQQQQDYEAFPKLSVDGVSSTKVKSNSTDVEKSVVESLMLMSHKMSPLCNRIVM